MNTAGDISRALSARILELCQEILPGGAKQGNEWRVGGVNGEPGRSLAVHLSGGKAGVWADFAADQGGDALDLVTQVRCGGHKAEAIKWGAAWLGLPESGHEGSVPSRSRSGERRSPDLDRETLDKIASARRIFNSAQARILGTPVDFYLQARGIDLRELGRQPGSIRYVPNLWNAESRQRWPAMVASVNGENNEQQAVHRTWLAQDRHGVWRKAPLQAPKASLGRVSGGSIRLWRGETGKRLQDAPEGSLLVVAEGIETALSIAMACPELRILSAVSLGNIGRVRLPLAITRIVIAADNDVAGGPAEAALMAAASRLREGGREVRIARSPVGSDMNDALQNGR